MSRLDEGVSVDAAAIVEQIPPGYAGVIKTTGLTVQRRGILVGYTDLMGLANRAGPAADTAGAIRDGLAQRIGTRLAGLATEEITPRRVLDWLIRAQPAELERATAEAVTLYTWLLRLEEGRRFRDRPRD